MVNITKTFGEVVANDKVCLDIHKGEILSLLGENGSGKTTLMNMLAGIYFPDGGEIAINGKPVTIASPKDAFDLHIGMIHQHFKLVDVLTAAENIILGLNEAVVVDLKRVRESIKQICDRYGFVVDPDKKVYDMSVSEKQTLEIVKVLYRGADILILDEPTAVLTPQEADLLFNVLDRLKGEGRALLYISHKLDEVKRLCDTATILRGGKKVDTCNPREQTAASMARMMVGADIGEVKATTARATTVPRLLVRDLSLEPDDPHGTYLRNISIEVFGGEILGIAGVAGNGQ
ncbi:MAG TPA: hypothetical protein DCY10_05235, partial [Clostridiales bacterium]|nr:hypothetical protein [Clostridiales bacterium]